MPKVKGVCKQCGRPTLFWPSQAREFCSLSCRSQWGVEHGNKPTKPRRGFTKPCQTCGQTIYMTKRQQTIGKKYCSVDCAHEGFRNGSQFTCEECGNTFYASPSYASSRRYCSRDCYESGRTKSAIGRKHNGREVIRDSGGYLRIWEPGHPAANQGRITEHRWIVEQELGWLLRTDEHVHHLNGVKDDNRLENLQVLDAQEHRLLTAKELKELRLSAADELAEYRKRYGPLT